MDISSVVGIFLAVGLIIAAILIGGGSFGAFVDYPSLMVVVGGAVAAAMMCFPLKNFLGTGGVLKNVFFNRPPQTRELIETIVELAEIAPFIVLGIQMAVDGTRPEIIEDIMRTEIDATATRHRDGKAVLDQMGRFAPAFGMIGTLMGLIIMLGDMSDPSKIGSGMAVALITTLYGAIVANAVFLPFAEKLGFLNKQEMLAMEIIIRGIMGIQAGDNPRVIEQKLSTFIPPKQRAGSKEAA